MGTHLRLKHVRGLALDEVSDVVVLEHLPRLVRVQCFELFSAVRTRTDGNGLTAAGVIVEEVRDIVHLRNVKFSTNDKAL